MVYERNWFTWAVQNIYGMFEKKKIIISDDIVLLIYPYSFISQINVYILYL